MIDLHTHSNASDGSLPPKALIQRAKEKGITILSLTDHDTIDGLEEAEKEADALGLKFIRGIELDIEFYPGDFHLLGYGLDNITEEVMDVLNRLKNLRDERNKHMIKNMREDGLRVDFNELKSLSGGDIISRCHFARYFKAKKIVKSEKEAYDKYLGRGKKFFIPKKTLTLPEGLALLKKAGGIPVLAHPLSLYLSWGRLPARLREWKDMGLEGVEVFHSGCVPQKSQRLETLCQEIGFLMTGGSDFHGPERRDRELGRFGNQGEQIMEQLIPFIERIA